MDIHMELAGETHVVTVATTGTVADLYAAAAEQTGLSDTAFDLCLADPASSSPPAPLPHAPCAGADEELASALCGHDSVHARVSELELNRRKVAEAFRVPRDHVTDDFLLRSLLCCAESRSHGQLGRRPGDSEAPSGSEGVALLLAAGADPEGEGARKWTPLAKAAYTGNDEAVGVLLRRGVAVDPRDDVGWTPLHHAADANAVECVRLLLEAGANPTLQDYRKRNAYIWAASRGSVESLRLLVDCGHEGMNLDHPGFIDRTALICATVIDSYECVQILLAAGAHVTGPTDAEGHCALELAVGERVRQLLQEAAACEGTEGGVRE